MKHVVPQFPFWKKRAEFLHIGVLRVRSGVPQYPSGTSGMFEVMEKLVNRNTESLV